MACRGDLLSIHREEQISLFHQLSFFYLAGEPFSGHGYRVDAYMEQDLQGGGVFVDEKMRGNPLVYNSATLVPYKDLRSQMIHLKKTPAAPKLQKIFDLKEKDMVWAFKRIRIMDHQKTQIETGYMPCTLFPVMDRGVVEDSIQEFAIEEGYRISHFMTNYRAAQLTREEAELLNCKKSTPAVLIKSRGFLRDGAVFVSSEIVAVDYECTYVVPFNKEVFRKRRKQ